MKAETRNELEALLKKHELTKITGKDIYIRGRTPNLWIVDLGIEPVFVGVNTGTARIEADTCGIMGVQDLKSEIMFIYSKDKVQKPAKSEKPLTPDTPSLKEEPPKSDSVGKFHINYFCAKCSSSISAEQRSASVRAHKKAYCGKCISELGQATPAKEEPTQKPEPVNKPVEETPKKYTCSGCGKQTNKSQAQKSEERFQIILCSDCFLKKNQGGTEKKEEKKPAKDEEIKKPLSDKELSKKLEAEEQKKAFAKTQFKGGMCEAAAKQYGIPAELANIFFMTLNDGLYIKNPGLLHLAAKKGYSRIEVTSKYNEKTQEWESESKIYPRVSVEMVLAICKLTPEMQKTAWEYVTAPTNGTGAASAKSVKMSTMQPFFKEMSQTRAQNRALRAYTGYGGTSLEELPEAEVKYIGG